MTDADGVLLGVEAAVDLERAVTRDSTQTRLAADLMREAPAVRTGDTLEDAVAVLATGDDEGIPVLDAEGRMVGWVTHRRVLRAYRQRAAGAGRHLQDGAADPGDASRAAADEETELAGLHE